MNKSFNKYQTILICIFLVVCTLAVYQRVLFSDFVNFDDQMYVTENRHVKMGLTGENIVWAFTSYDVAYWHPLTWLSHMLDCQLYRLRPGMHHLSSLLIHIANSLLLFLVFKRLTGAVWRSALVAAIFALHPFNVDSVAWIAERKNVLSTLFWLLTMWAYAGYAHRGGAGRYLLTLLLYALGLLSKPMLVTLPFVMLLLDYWPLGRFRFERADGDRDADDSEPRISRNRGIAVFRLVCEKIPFFVLSVVSVLSFWWAVERPGTAVSKAVVPIKLRLANALVSYVSYIGKMLWPRKFAVYYPYPDAVPMWQVTGALLLVVCVSVLVILALKRRPYPAVGWLWYLGTLVPVIGLYQAGLWPATADRWAYVPLIGLFVIIAWGADDVAAKWRLRKLALGIGAGVWLSALMVCTWVQVGHWRNGYTLFTHALAVTQGNYIAHYNLGNILLREEKTDKAIEQYKKAIAVHRRYVDAHYNLGIALSDTERYAEAVEEYRIVQRLEKNHKRVLFRLANALAKNGQVDEAISYYNKALEQKPNDAEILNNFGLALVKKGEIDEAIKHYEKSLEVKPDSVEVLNNLGNALVKQKEFDQAVACYKKALSLEPDFAETQYNLGNALRQTGQIDEAVVCYREALRLRPDNVDTHYGLGLVLAQQKKYDEAAIHYRKAIQLNPDFARAHYNLGLVFFNQKKTDKAIEQFRQVLRIRPDDAEMHCNLGIVLVQKGRVDDAIGEFRTALRLDPGLAKAREQLEAALVIKAAPRPQ